ncbi:MAG: hypothetical protein WC655_09350 [Candidatus Hydrogenedentales bacterium]
MLILEMIERDLRVTYAAYLYDEESYVNTVVTFREVLALETYAEGCCSACHADLFVEFGEVTVHATSDWLTKVLRRWNERVGWTELQKSLGGDKRFRHYQIFFDHVMGIQVVAASCEINPEDGHAG